MNAVVERLKSSPFRPVALACLCSLLSMPAMAVPKGAAPAKPVTAAPASITAVTRVEGIHEYRLANGLQVLLFPDDSKPTTTVNLTYRVGSRHEGYGETGMAHLLEHLLFKGTPSHPEVWSEFNQRGLQANGSTWLDRTNYYASFSANPDNLRWYLQWQADAMVNSFIARKDLDSEMTVVRNEMEMGENSPGNILLEKTLSAMYQWHNYGKATIGARSDVEGVDIARLKAFYQLHYQPDNATLIVSGKFDPVQTLSWIEQAFGRIPASRTPRPRLYTLDPVQDGERQVVLRRAGGAPTVMAGYHVMPGAHPDFAAIELLGSILTDPPAGRLHQALVDRQLAAEVFSFAPGLADPGFMVLGAQLGSQHDPEKASAALIEVLEGLDRNPIRADELERARTRWLNQWESGFTDAQQVGVALSEAVAQGDWRLFFLTRDRVRGVTLEQIQRVATEVLRPANRTLGRYVPTEQPQRAPVPARVDVAEQLRTFKPSVQAAAVAPFDASPANVDARTLRQRIEPGVDLALLPKETRGQSVRAQLVLRYGSAEALQGWGEAPGALAALLDKGSATLSRQQIADRLDALQSKWAFKSGPGTLTVMMESRRAHLPALMGLLGEVLRQPALTAPALDEVRAQALAMLEDQRKEPEAVLERELARHGNPWPRGDVRHARSVEELEADWKSLDASRVRDFHRRFLGASNAQFSAVGDFDAEASKASLENAFRGWASPASFARVPLPFREVAPAALVIETPDKQNAVVTWRQAWPIGDRHPDYAALTMANYLLGFGGDSRLWRRVREKEGLSYSVFSNVTWGALDEHTLWMASANFAPQNRQRVEQAMNEEIERVLTEGFTAAELESGRRGLLNFRQLSRAQDERLTAALATNAWLGRTMADSARLDAELKALTVDQVNAALRRHLQPARFVRGAAGDFR